MLYNISQVAVNTHVLSASVWCHTPQTNLKAQNMTDRCSFSATKYIVKRKSEICDWLAESKSNPKHGRPATVIYCGAHLVDHKSENYEFLIDLPRWNAILTCNFRLKDAFSPRPSRSHWLDTQNFDWPAEFRRNPKLGRLAFVIYFGARVVDHIGLILRILIDPPRQNAILVLKFARGDLLEFPRSRSQTTIMRIQDWPAQTECNPLNLKLPYVI